MTQKILNTLQKIPPESRCVWGALLLAVLLHVLLVLLFGHTPVRTQEDVGALPTVGRIILSDGSNAELAVWLKNHDPSVTTAADPVFGYSSVMSQEHLRNEPEDLPNLLQPVMPQNNTGISEVGELTISRKKLMPPGVFLHTAAIKPMPGAGVPVTIDGCYAYNINEMLTEVLKDVKTLPELQKMSDTVLETVPGRMAGTTSRVILLKSSGNNQLDKLAVKTLHKYIMKKSNRFEPGGRAVFSWRNVKGSAGRETEQKL